ncbi:MAG TPA: hypothetical protein VFZ53_01675 [Polyangiaceae bacterium]
MRRFAAHGDGAITRAEEFQSLGSSFRVSEFDVDDGVGPNRGTGRRVEALSEAPPERTPTIAFVMFDSERAH